MLLLVVRLDEESLLVSRLAGKVRPVLGLVRKPFLVLGFALGFAYVPLLVVHLAQKRLLVSRVAGTALLFLRLAHKPLLGFRLA